ncbi:hypothetical protein LSO9J_150009 [Candidatus Liberibacter solanacearum]
MEELKYKEPFPLTVTLKYKIRYYNIDLIWKIIFSICFLTNRLPYINIEKYALYQSVLDELYYIVAFLLILALSKDNL